MLLITPALSVCESACFSACLTCVCVKLTLLKEDWDQNRPLIFENIYTFQNKFDKLSLQH